MQRWPIFTMTAAAAVALSSIGREFLHGAFFTGEQLARNIAQPIVYSSAAILVVLGVLEWWIRRIRARRRRA